MTKFKKCTLIGFAWALAGLLLPEYPRGISFVIGAAGAMVVAARHLRNRDEKVRSVARFIVAAGVTSLLGVLVRSAHGMFIDETFPLPSPADIFTLATYPLLVWGIIKIVRQRVGRIKFDLVIDSLIAGAAAAVAQWSLLLRHIVANAQITPEAVVVHCIYALMGLGVLMAAVGLLVAGGHRSTSNRLLGSALILTFIMDNLGTAMAAMNRSETIVLYFAPFIYALAMAGILHPSIDLIISRPTDERAMRGISTKRIVVMAFAMIVPPALVLGFLWNGGTRESVVPAGGALVLAVLVLIRLAKVVRDRERFAEQESKLRSVSESLVVAQSNDDVSDSILAGAAELLGGLLVNVVVEIPARSLAGEQTVDGRPVMDLIDDENDPTSMRSGTLIDLAGPRNRVAYLIVSDRSLSGIMLLETTSALDEPSSNALSTLCREGAIALRAVARTERTVRERSEARFESLIRNSSDILAVLNDRRELVYVSSVAERLLGYPISTMRLSTLTQMQQSTSDESRFSGTVVDLIHPDDRGAAGRWMDSIELGNRSPIELRVQHFAGGYSWFEFAGTDMSDDPNVLGLVLNVREISDRKHAEEQLQRSEARFKALVQNTSDLVIVFSPDGTITYASPSVPAVIGMPMDSVLGRPFDDAFAHNDLSRALVEDPGAWVTNELLEFHFDDIDGKRRTVEASISDQSDEPAIGGLVINARDVTDRREMQAQLLYQATHDELTGLANRPNALGRLSSILSKNSGSTTVALALFDIDDLRDVNDSLGHEVGDELLIELSQRLASCITAADVAARISGDEFIVVVERSHGEDQIMDLAYDILGSMSEPFFIRGREISISVTAGIAFDHDRQHTAELMLRNADTAMHRAKEGQRREIAVFEPHMHTATFDRLELRADLARAVAHNQFEAFYQPIVELGTNRIAGAEALVRWRHPQRGLVGPNLFIPLAEETGLISAIGEWMLRQATHDLAGWLDDFDDSMEQFTISVNLSPQQLRNTDLADSVDRILQESAMSADRLVLEITESTLITESTGAVEMMKNLRSRGIKLSIDDFGTGYSSLGYIQQFEFDVLKIDKSFIDEIGTETNRRIVQTVIELAENLEVKTIAEGIEHQDQVDVLTGLGCPFGQGYVFSRPVPESEFRELLAKDVLTPSEAAS